MQEETGSFEKEHESLGLFVIGMYLLLRMRVKCKNYYNQIRMIAYLDVFKSMVGIYHTLHPRSKELTLFAMLHVTGALMKGNQKFLIRTLADTMVEALLFGWIQAKYVLHSGLFCILFYLRVFYL
jgi:hypothetical protein